MQCVLSVEFGIFFETGSSMSWFWTFVLWLHCFAIFCLFDLSESELGFMLLSLHKHVMMISVHLKRGTEVQPCRLQPCEGRNPASHNEHQSTPRCRLMNAIERYNIDWHEADAPTNLTTLMDYYTPSSYNNKMDAIHKLIMIGVHIISGEHQRCSLVVLFAALWGAKLHVNWAWIDPLWRTSSTRQQALKNIHIHNKNDYYSKSTLFYYYYSIIVSLIILLFVRFHCCLSILKLVGSVNLVALLCM